MVSMTGRSQCCMYVGHHSRLSLVKWELEALCNHVFKHLFLLLHNTTLWCLCHMISMYSILSFPPAIALFPFIPFTVHGFDVANVQASLMVSFLCIDSLSLSIRNSKPCILQMHRIAYQSSKHSFYEGQLPDSDNHFKLDSLLFYRCISFLSSGEHWKYMNIGNYIWCQMRLLVLSGSVYL